MDIVYPSPIVWDGYGADQCSALLIGAQAPIMVTSPACDHQALMEVASLLRRTGWLPLLLN